MKTTSSETAFTVLVGASMALTVLVASGLIHALRAASYGDWADILGILVPTEDDLSTHLLSYILAGMIIAAAYRGFRAWRTQCSNLASLSGDLKMLETTCERCSAALSIPGLRGRVDVIDSAVPFCFCFGFISPRIYISRGMIEKLTIEEMEAVLLHEKYHLDKRDPLKMMLGSIIISALFFVPVLRDVFVRYLEEKELAADQNAVRYQGHKRGIAGALYKILQEKSAFQHSLVASSDYLVEKRIDRLLEKDIPKKYSFSPAGLAISLIGISFVIYATLAPLPTHTH